MISYHQIIVVFPFFKKIKSASIEFSDVLYLLFELPSKFATWMKKVQHFKDLDIVWKEEEKATKSLPALWCKAAAS